MAVSRSAAKKSVPVARDTKQLVTFVWQGTDKRGVKMKGEQEARNANLLRAELRGKGITPSVLKPKPKPLFGAAGKPIKPGDIAFFSRQMATMMKSGVPIITSLEIISGGHKNPRMKKMLEGIRTDIEGGSSMTEAISKYPVQFDELYRNLVRAGEGAGVLETVLDTVATYKENLESLKGKIKKALFYPAMTIAVALIVSAILLIFVVPQFQAVFESFGADLPAFTKMIVAASDVAISYWWLAVLVIGGGIFAFIFFMKRSLKFQHFVDRSLLKVPVMGKILHNSAIARFSRTLAVTFKAGVPLVEALDTVAGATGNTLYEQAVHRIRDDVAVGYPVNMAMKQTNLFPHMVIQMTAIGEEAGALDTMLFKVAEYFEQEVNNAVDALSSLIEPMIMVILGVLVGGMVIGMYLPIFKLGAAI
ncbi:MULTISPECIES: type II secretion system F family protein [Pseudoxanthomonas]|uniref:Type IV pilus assembly protein PilC n=1 Tax=Pseudoxanthomonas winnipegensis TaxID=2480810 RepID=A0AAW8GEH8_9GAMM|nr:MULTISPECIES: type II secretion system F family protein [Pseudoxanthomonas]MDQ1119640.1 type IV pilus assembly protein PilC [Pseudoxanthomonas winnipegensis]MDQ1132835.1 type IV pilus assembly protein PilC [Pseudoxanthomonas winnipegensis]MDR6137158.1 type IV pilus assembly protein PilC [Pseudoxanthomonas sp. SORGH_AS_0997]TBV71409.1 type II secretion system F family protein [Pseudoxanthomonas winnipegensis]